MLAFYPVRKYENSSKCNHFHQEVILKICLYKRQAGFLTLTHYGFILKLCMWGQTDVGSPQSCVYGRLSRRSDKSIVWGWGYLHYISHKARDKWLSPLYELHQTQPTAPLLIAYCLCAHTLKLTRCMKPNTVWMCVTMMEMERDR